MNKCSECGETMTAVTGKTVPFPAGIPNVQVTGATVFTCPNGHTETEYPPLAAVLKELTRLVTEQRRRLNGPEIRLLRKQLGFSSKDFARYFCVEPATASRWENDKQTMDDFKEKMLRMLAAHGALLEDYGGDIDPTDRTNADRHDVYVVEFRPDPPKSTGRAKGKKAASG